MDTIKRKYRFLFAGGGTGGHLFPAIAVAEKIRTLLPESEILFVGSKSKIEGRVVPKLGFEFSPIWIKGFSRKLTFENLLFPLKLIVSIIQSIIINMKFKPDVAIGTGGYVAGPAIYGSSLIGAKIILIEQNSYPGITTKLLSKYADEIHISFEDSLKFFSGLKKVFVTGNPVREILKESSKEEALKEFKLSINKKTLLILGGSLGAGSINEAVAESAITLEKNNIQIIWQTGNYYFSKYKNLSSANIIVVPFIDKMNIAYSACDLMVARAGATTIAELLSLGIPSILVPSPNVAENHQFFNAKSLSDKNAAILIEDNMIHKKLSDEVISIISNLSKLKDLRQNAILLSKPNATAEIAQHAIKFAINN